MILQINEEILEAVDSMGVCASESLEWASKPITSYIIEGGWPGMIAITLFLIALFLAAWKAPKWVREIGIGALVVGIFWTLRGLTQMFDVLQRFADTPFSVICGGLKVALISTMYGLIVYFISLVIRVIQKPRI